MDQRLTPSGTETDGVSSVIQSIQERVTAREKYYNYLKRRYSTGILGWKIQRNEVCNRCLCRTKHSREDISWWKKTENNARPPKILCKPINNYFQSDKTQSMSNIWKEVFFMSWKKHQKNYWRISSTASTSTTDILNSMEELFSDVLQQVMEAVQKSPQ